MSRRPWITAVTVALLALALRMPTFAASAILQVVAKNPSPLSGSNATFELAISPNGGSAWPAGSYSVTLFAADADGNTVASSDAVVGAEPIAVGQSAIVFANLAIPRTFAGTLTVFSRVVHGSASSNGDPVAIQAVLVPPTPPSGFRTLTGTLALNASFSANNAQSAALNLSGKPTALTSFTSSGGLSSTPGADKPVVTFQSPAVVAEAGTFAPTLDRDTFAGVTGAGVDLRRSWGPLHLLQVAYIAGDAATPNPFDITAIAYTLPLWNNPLTVTGGVESQSGPVPSGETFLQHGSFFGFGYDAHAAHSSFAYSVHYGMTTYFDASSGVERSDRVYDVVLGGRLRKATLGLNYLRTGPYYAILSAPGLTPDRESLTFSINVPVGLVLASASVSGYHDDLAGSPLTQATHYWSENASLSYPIRPGDSISLQSTNGIEHQTGNPLAPFSGNDATTFAYTTRRGAYTVQYSFASQNQRSNDGTLIHVWTDGLTVGRAAFAGFTLATGFNVTENEANMSDETGTTDSVTGSLSYNHGPFAFSTQINHGLDHAAAGPASPPTTTYNYGISLKPVRQRISFTATLTENVGIVNSSSAALSLNRQF